MILHISRMRRKGNRNFFNTDLLKVSSLFRQTSDDVEVLFLMAKNLNETVSSMFTSIDVL